MNTRLAVKNTWERRKVIYAAMWFLFAVFCVARVVAGPVRAPSDDEALIYALRAQGLSTPQGVEWLDRSKSWLYPRRVLFVAEKKGQSHDVYLANVQFGVPGLILRVSGLRNLTRSPASEEHLLARLGDTVLVTSRVGSNVESLLLVEPNTEPKLLTQDWPWWARTQNAITNWQDTGQTQGVGQWRFVLEPPAQSVRVLSQSELFAIDLDGEMLRLNPQHPEQVKGPGIEVQAPAKVRPGLITWMVDTVRRVSWVGPRAIEWLEHHVFKLQDVAQRTYYQWAGANTAEQIAAELPTQFRRNIAHNPTTGPPLEIGWPPPALKPVVAGRVQGEGEWIPIESDPFVQAYPHAPAAFAQTFLRADPERMYAPVYITAWDPRQVQLHIAMGTREPESATGETGPGLIPRDEATLRHLVAGFNGGFQALHGEFGMMAEGRVYLPPKPWAATVAVMDDGRVGLGSWPPPPQGKTGYEEDWATAQIPKAMVAMRQNLTSVVESGTFNPWKRWWWGAAPPDAKEQTLTHRSGMCLTREGFLAYFWGTSLSADALGAAMLATRCVRGMHLDMNSGHCGFEFLRVEPEHASAALLRPGALSDSEYEGVLPLTAGYRMRARKAVRSMSNTRFPRYVHQDPRDFFYLTLKPTLPGPDLSAGLTNASPVTFSYKDLPQPSWPFAFAKTTVGQAQGTAIRIVRMDIRRAVPKPLSTAGQNQPLAFLRGVQTDARPATATHALYATRERIGWKLGVGALPEGAVPIAWGKAFAPEPVPQKLLVVDRDGFVIYVESENATFAVLADVLKRLYAKHTLVLEDSAKLVFVEGAALYDVRGVPQRKSSAWDTYPWFAETRPPTEVLFPNTQPKPYGVWGHLQGQRVRYVPTHPPRFRGPQR